MSVGTRVLDGHFHASIAEIPRAAWDRLFPGSPDSWSYYRAIEEAPPPAIEFGAVSASSGEELAAAAPCFRLEYRLSTSLHGRARRASDWLYSLCPWLASKRLIAIGSPLLDSCTLGFAAGLGPHDRQEAFDTLLRRLEAAAQQHRCGLMVVKSLDDHQAACFHKILSAHGFTRITSLPTVVLDLPYQRFDEYLHHLGQKRRGDMRRKLRSLEKVRVEYRTSVSALEPQLFTLFENTRAQSKGEYNQFEMLHPNYFAAACSRMGKQFKIMLCWQGEELVGFLTFLVGKDRIIGRDLGLKYPQARRLNLYFVQILKTIEFAIEHGITTLDMGATTYRTKLLFGGRLERKWLYFKFTNRVANRLFAPLGPLFDFERNDPDLRRRADTE